MEQFGGPEVLVCGRASDPVAAPDGVVVDVAFANITFVETQFRARGFGPFPATLPMIPGNGVGGLVRSVGSGVDPALVGRRVVASLGGSGGYAERVAVDAGSLVAVPDGVDLDVATALMADGRTASGLVEDAALRPGERVLVEAAGGGVGSLLVKLSVAAGARVVGAAGGAGKVDLARSLGAEVGVDYRRPEWVDEVRAAVGGVDAVFDGVGGEIGRSAFSLVVPGGRIVSFGMASGHWLDIPDEEAAARDVRVVRSTRRTPDELRALTATALAEAAAGTLRPVIGQVFPLEQAAAAHAAIESRRTFGKTLLTP